jgi:hypothetical protein
MRKLIAKKWIKALQSGKYKQGEGYLKQINSRGKTRHCCLGVLCELYNDSMKKNHKKTLNIKSLECFSNRTAYISFNNQDAGLPAPVKKWAGIKNSLGEFRDSNNNLNCLADLNDTGKRFKTIANIINENMENL